MRHNLIPSMKTFITLSRSKKAMLILFTALSLLAACKKDKDDSHPAPVTNPLSIVSAKNGDTIKIQGTNFTTDTNQVKVSFNGIAGTVVSSSATEIVVVIPEGATSGNVTVTVYGNTVDAGALTITPLTLYTIKGTKESSGKITYELVGIDPATAAVSTIFTLPDNFTIRMYHYLPATKEIVGLDYTNTQLVKINVVTKQTSAIPISMAQNQEYDWLQIDKAGNLYTVGFRKVTLGHLWTITKIDPATGNTTALASFNNSLQGFQYIPATNELVGMSPGLLRKYNITTKDTSSVIIAGGASPLYENMGVDNNSNLYAFKAFTDGRNYSHIVKLNPVTGTENVVAILNAPEPIYDLLYVPKLNELVSIWEATSLYKFNLGTNKTTLLPLTTASNVGFDDPTIN